MSSILFLLATSLSILKGAASSSSSSEAVNLGSLHWCDTLCLCRDESNDKAHCFAEREIYDLLQMKEALIQRITKTNFAIRDKLMWCSETCLCHKDKKKDFKCTDRTRLGQFIRRAAPDLVQFLEPEMDVYDVRDVQNGPTESGHDAASHDKPRHDRKRNRKHRKNRKKTPHLALPALQNNSDFHSPDMPPSETPIHTANAALPQPSANVPPPPRSPTNAPTNATTPSADKESQRERQAEDLAVLHGSVDRIGRKVATNRLILLAAMAVAGAAFIGVLILAIYFCCSRKTKEGAAPAHNNHHHSPLQRDDNALTTKVSLNQEAW